MKNRTLKKTASRRAAPKGAASQAARDAAVIRKHIKTPRRSKAEIAALKEKFSSPGDKKFIRQFRRDLAQSIRFRNAQIGASKKTLRARSNWYAGNPKDKELHKLMLSYRVHELRGMQELCRVLTDKCKLDLPEELFKYVDSEHARVLALHNEQTGGA